MKRKMLFVGTVVDEYANSLKVNFGKGISWTFWIPKTAISRQSNARRRKK